MVGPSKERAGAVVRVSVHLIIAKVEIRRCCKRTNEKTLKRNKKNKCEGKRD